MKQHRTVFVHIQAGVIFTIKVFEDREEAIKHWEEQTGILWDHHCEDPDLYRKKFEYTMEDYHLERATYHPRREN